jgi:hypothetical protein
LINYEGGKKCFEKVMELKCGRYGNILGRKYGNC